jgi:hypothetical protein
LLQPLKDIQHTPGGPLAFSGRRVTLTVEGFCHGIGRCDPLRPQVLQDTRQHLCPLLNPLGLSFHGLTVATASQVCSPLGIPQLHSTCLRSSQGSFGPLGNQCLLIFSRSRINMQHEWVSVCSKLSDHEPDTASHEARDKVNITAATVQLCHHRHNT